MSARKKQTIRDAASEIKLLYQELIAQGFTIKQSFELLKILLQKNK